MNNNDLIQKFKEVVVRAMEDQLHGDFDEPLNKEDLTNINYRTGKYRGVLDVCFSILQRIDTVESTMVTNMTDIPIESLHSKE